MKIAYTLRKSIWALAGVIGISQATLASEITDAMRSELQFAMTALAKQPVPPYFLAYEITDQDQIVIGSSFGTLVTNTQSLNRQLDIDLRVGSYQLDNTRRAVSATGSSAAAGSNNGYRAIMVPIEGSSRVLRHFLRQQTDERYRSAVAQLTRIKANKSVGIDNKDDSADFSKETPQQYFGQPIALTLDKTLWEEKIRACTAPFSGDPKIHSANCTLQANVQTRRLVNSEGTVIEDARPVFQLEISAITKADDGMNLPRLRTFFATTPEQLPSDQEIKGVVSQMLADLEALRRAPLTEPYTGPAIISGRASGVFFHEIFGHRIEGHRLKDVNEGQTFKEKLGTQILPKFLSINFDPTINNAAGLALAGHYRYDNQGVLARRVTAVDRGVFKSFLMSRAPNANFANSNGHGRNQIGNKAVARQSNLLVEAHQSVSHAALKKQLLKLVRSQGKPYGLLIDDIQGGFTFTGRQVANSFNVSPHMVYRVFPDGRAELVRGVDLIGTPLIALSKIVAADNELGVFNGMCGAESGNVPVAAVSPGLLISQIEVQRKDISQQRLPILPHPAIKPAAAQE